MNPFTLATGIGIMDEDWFIDGFKIVNQNMVNDTITKISKTTSLPQLRNSAPRVYL